MKTLSIIVPCYNEQEAVPIFYNTVTETLKPLEQELDYTVLFVDDGSFDATLSVIKDISLNDGRVKYISFSRNFGKEAAMYAGLENCDSDYVAIMDVDLQDPPALLLDMYDMLEKGGCDCVAARRVSRKGEPPIRSFFARLFYKLMRKMSTTDIVDGARDFRMMTGQMAKAILSLKEYNRFSKGLFGWVGFNTQWLEYENVKRCAGETKWSFWKLFLYSLDGIVAFSVKPLAFASILGLVFFAISMFMIVFIIIKTLIFGDPVSGWPSAICIIFMVSGVQLFTIGVLGQYISKIYLETKNRPIYIIKKTNIER